MILSAELPTTLKGFIPALWGTEPSNNQHCGKPGAGGYPTLWGPVHLDRTPTSLDLSDMA
jgi:hypothetical protein